MSTITLTEAQEQLTAWLAASKAVANNSEYRINGRLLRRTDAAEVREMVNYWSNIVSSLTRSNSGLPGTSYSTANFS